MTSKLRLVEFAIALFGLFFMSGTLNSLLAPPGAVSAPMVQAIGGALGLYSVVALLLIRDAIGRTLGLYWPMILPVALAVMSLAWSEDVSLTLRRSGSLVLTTAFALWLAFRFTPTQIFRLVVIMAVAIVIANFAVIQLWPSRGIHQASDVINPQHAGKWRGLFGHKNDFGRLISLVIAILAIAFFLRTGGPRWRWIFLPLIALSVLMIARSQSSQAAMLSATVPTAVVALLAMRNMSPTGRSVLLVVALPFAVIAALSAQLVFEYVLGLLGRDATLTGRTEIWEGVILSLRETAVLGGGYGAGWQIVGDRLAALTGIEVGHAHNGFLDLVVDIGTVGLVITLIFMLWLGALAFRYLMQGVRPEISALALAMVIFAFVGNVAGSFLLLHNSVFWVLPVVTFVKLRDVPYRTRQAQFGTRRGYIQRTRQPLGQARSL